MAQEQDEASSSSYYDFFDDQEMMMDMALLPPHFGADVPEGGGEPPAHATQLGNRTTTGCPVPPPGAPNYPYPTALSHTRAGARHLPINTTTAPSPTGSLLAAAPATATSTSYPSRPIAPYGIQPTLNWGSSANNSLYHSSSDSGSRSAPNPFGFTFGTQNTQPSTTSGSYSDYVASDSLQTPQQPNFDFSYPTSSWNETRDGNTALAGNPLALSSSISADDSVDAGALPISGSASTVGSLTSSRHKRAKKSTSSAAAEDESTSPDTSATCTHASRASFSSKSTASSTGVVAGSNTGGNKTKLRSASRTSKNTHHKPAETAEERKMRASHNLVEKQYRNRLNAQFEALLNVLPDTARAEGGNGDSDELDPERRVSKAEVLDRARRHIKQLERDRAQLEHERDELLGSVERLQETYTQGLVPETGIVLHQPGPSYTNLGEGHAGARGTDVLDET